MFTPPSLPESTPGGCCSRCLSARRKLAYRRLRAYARPERGICVVCSEQRHEGRRVAARVGNAALGAWRDRVGSAAEPNVEAIAALVGLTDDVQRVLHTTGPPRVEVPPLLTAEGAERDASVGRETAERVEPELAALRRFLLDKSADGRTLGADGVGAATTALRNLLEIALDEQLRLNGDGPKRKRTTEDDLDAALKAAVAVEPRKGARRAWTARDLTAGDLTLDGCGEWTGSSPPSGSGRWNGIHARDSSCKVWRRVARSR